MKQRVFVTILFLCIVAPIATVVFCLHYHQLAIRKHIKQQIIAGLDKDQLQKFSFTTAQKQTQLKWYKKHEFKYDGFMYDVVHSEFNGDTTHFWCWKDSHEDKIRNELNDLVSHAADKDSSNRNTKIKLQQFLDTLFFEEPYNWKPLRITQNTSSFLTTEYRYSKAFLSRPFPPPKFG